jgi:hypothetical protein
MAHVLLADELGGRRREQQIIAFRTRRQREASHRCTGLRVDLPAHGVLHRAIPSASLESRTDRVSRLSVFQLDLVSRARWNRMHVVWQQHGAYVNFF